MLATQKLITRIEVETPSGTRLDLNLVEQEMGRNFAKCGVVKDAGDDPDVTNGARIFAEVRFCTTPGVAIIGGPGVGRVTKPGLAVDVGEPAINPTPRKMLLKEVAQFLPKDKGMEVIISVPNGEELALRTFNPRLGIVGGISIIGTTGIVEPKSLDAYKASLALQLDVLVASGLKRVNLVLGYVGERYCKEALGQGGDSIIKIGDYVGFMIEECAKRGLEEIFVIGHIGKLIKVAGGQLNTHSRFGDGRIDTVVSFAKRIGADEEILRDLSHQATAEGTIEVLKRNGLMKIFDEVASAAVAQMKRPLKKEANITCIVLSLQGEMLGRCPKSPLSLRGRTLARRSQMRKHFGEGGNVRPKQSLTLNNE